MKTKIIQKLQQHIKKWIILFMILLLLSGSTAFPLEWELSLLYSWTQQHPGPFNNWISTVYEAIQQTNAAYPFMAYGTDWLAFAHIVIAIAFIGPLKDPVKNKWVLQFGMIACALVLPLAFICGNLRQIPVYWQLIDCSFGIIGMLPLYITYKKIVKLEQLTNNQKTIK